MISIDKNKAIHAQFKRRSKEKEWWDKTTIDVKNGLSSSNFFKHNSQTGKLPYLLSSRFGRLKFSFFRHTTQYSKQFDGFFSSTNDKQFAGRTKKF